MSNAVSLSLRGVSKTYGNVQALKPLSIDVQPGEMLALLGPSGCGKTTTLRIIAGFETPETGSVFFGDKDVTELPPNKRAIGMVFQNYSLFPHMTVGENVAYGLKVRGMANHERTVQVRKVLDVMRLGGFEAREIHQLSGGQQQRVALARAIVTNPNVLLLDEPLGALDKNLRERMQFELREIQRQFGITSILVTHDQDEALTMSDRIAVMSEGQVLQVGTPADVYTHPNSQFVSEFLGTSNVLHAKVLGIDLSGAWQVSLPCSDNVTCLVTNDSALTPGEMIKVAIRPEQIRFVSVADATLKAKIQDVVFRGSYYAYEMFVEGGDSTPVYAYSQHRLDASADHTVGLTWTPESAVVLRGE